jgi:hypothetical protein
MDLFERTKSDPNGFKVLSFSWHRSLRSNVKSLAKITNQMMTKRPNWVVVIAGDNEDSQLDGLEVLLKELNDDRELGGTLKKSNQTLDDRI